MFRFGDTVFTYYRYLDKFHCEPKSFLDLFEFLSYTDTDSRIHKIIADATKEK